MTFENHTFYNCKITLSDQKEYLVNANWVHNQGLDKWQGWQCNAGYDRILIASDLTVYSGECNNDVLGNLATSWDLLDRPTTCNKITCTGCTDDLIISKQLTKVKE